MKIGWDLTCLIVDGFPNTIPASVPRPLAREATMTTSMFSCAKGVGSMLMAFLLQIAMPCESSSMSVNFLSGWTVLIGAKSYAFGVRLTRVLDVRTKCESVDVFTSCMVCFSQSSWTLPVWGFPDRHSAG